VTGQDHWPLRARQRLGRLACVVEVDVAVELVAGDFETIRRDPVGLRHLHVFADVDQHRPGPARGRDVKRLVDDARQLVDVGDQIAVLGDR